MKTTMLQLAGLLHVSLICAGAMMPRVVGISGHVAALPVFIRNLFWTYYVFIGLSIVGFGAITFIFADDLAAGTPLSRAFCGFLAAFWALRLFVACFYFDLRPWLTSPFRRVGYHCLNFVFVYLLIVYAVAAFKP